MKSEMEDLEPVSDDTSHLVTRIVFVLIVNQGAPDGEPVWVRTRIAEMIEVNKIRASAQVLHEEADLETVWYDTLTDEYFALADRRVAIEVIKAGL